MTDNLDPLPYLRMGIENLALAMQSVSQGNPGNARECVRSARRALNEAMVQIIEIEQREMAVK